MHNAISPVVNHRLQFRFITRNKNNIHTALCNICYTGARNTNYPQIKITLCIYQVVNNILS